MSHFWSTIVNIHLQVKERWIYNYIAEINRALELSEAVPLEEQERYLKRYCQIWVITFILTFVHISLVFYSFVCTFYLSTVLRAINECFKGIELGKLYPVTPLVLRHLHLIQGPHLDGFLWSSNRSVFKIKF